MKFLLALLLSLSPLAASAEPIDQHVQAMITDARYVTALGYAQKAVADLGGGYQLSFGSTSQLHIGNSQHYFFYMPVLAKRAFGRETKTVGNLVGQMAITQDNRLPAVEGLYFEPVASPPGNM